MVTGRLMLAGCVLAWSMAAAAASGQSSNADVALAPFAVAGDNASELRAVADDCLGQMATALAGKGVKVSRFPSLDERTSPRRRSDRGRCEGNSARGRRMSRRAE